MMLSIPLFAKEALVWNQIIPTMLLMDIPANLVLLLSPFLATISLTFIMRVPILLLIASTTMDHIQFMFTSMITGVIIQTESLMIPTVTHTSYNHAVINVGYD